VAPSPQEGLSLRVRAHRLRVVRVDRLSLCAGVSDACGNDGWDDDRCPERRSVQGGDILERAKDVDTVVFDKTGTLTKGEMERRTSSSSTVTVSRSERRPITGRDRLSENDVLRLAATAESGSEHPLARAIVDGARDRGIDVSDPDDFENVPGHGIRATVGDSGCWSVTESSSAITGSTPRPLRKRWSASRTREDGDARRPRARWHGRGRTRRCGR